MSLSEDDRQKYKVELKNSISVLANFKTQQALMLVGCPLSEAHSQILKELVEKQDVLESEELIKIELLFIDISIQEKNKLSNFFAEFLLLMLEENPDTFRQHWPDLIAFFQKTVRSCVENYALFWRDAYSDLDPLSWPLLQSFVARHSIVTLPEVKTNNLSFIESMSPVLEGLQDKNDFYKQVLYAKLLSFYNDLIKTVEEKNKLSISQNFINKERLIFFVDAVSSMMALVKNSLGPVFNGQRIAPFENVFDSYGGVNDIVGVMRKAKNIFLEKKSLIVSIVKVIAFHCHVDRMAFLSLGQLISLAGLFKSINNLFESVDTKEISCFEMFFYQEILCDLKITEDIFLKVLTKIKEDAKELKKDDGGFLVANALIKYCLENARSSGVFLYKVEWIANAEYILRKFYPTDAIAKTLQGFFKGYAEKPGQNDLLFDLNTFISTVKILEIELACWLGSEDFETLQGCDFPGMIVLKKESLSIFAKKNQTISSASYKESLLSTNKKFSEQFKKAALLVENPKTLKAGFLLMTVALLTGIQEKNTLFVEKVLPQWIGIASVDLGLLTIDLNPHWILYMMVKCLLINERLDVSDERDLFLFLDSALKSIRSFYENGLCLTPENKKILKDLLNLQRLEKLFVDMALARVLEEEEQAESEAVEREKAEQEQHRREKADQERAAQEMAAQKKLEQERLKKEQADQKQIKKARNKQARAAQSQPKKEKPVLTEPKQMPREVVVSEPAEDDSLTAASVVDESRGGSSLATDSVLSESRGGSSLAIEPFEIEVLRQQFEQQAIRSERQISWQQLLLFYQQAQINRLEAAAVSRPVFFPVPVPAPLVFFGPQWQPVPGNTNLVFNPRDPGIVYNVNLKPQ